MNNLGRVRRSQRLGQGRPHLVHCRQRIWKVQLALLEHVYASLDSRVNRTIRVIHDLLLKFLEQDTSVVLCRLYRRLVENTL